MKHGTEKALASRTANDLSIFAAGGLSSDFYWPGLKTAGSTDVLSGLTSGCATTVIQIGARIGGNVEAGASLVAPVGQFRADDMFGADDWVVPPIAHDQHWESDFVRGTTIQPDRLMSPKPVVKATQLPPVGSATPQRRYTPLQQWEGLVCKIGQETFWADLCDLTDPEAPRESAEIYWDEVPEADRPLVEIGSVFYWTIGYNHGKGGQLERTSEIRLRRLAKWSKKDIDAANRKAEELLKQLEANAAV